MQNIRSILTRFRLLTSVIALAVLLSALAVPPARADRICDDLCWGWTAKSGCTNCNHCCVENGNITCAKKADSDCGTGGPTQPEID
jgi:hypothetical protein